MSNNAYLYRKLINDYWFQTVENPQSFDECDQYLDGKIKLTRIGAGENREVLYK